ncbi:MAG: transcription elongation factor GreB [Verrucomicrobia bacterium]|nr:transcription elongation factor GreB [Verrucomicrobiota bacterium]
MSKAFTRESDVEREEWTPPPPPSLPPGAKNYMTQAGAARLRAELSRLLEVRPDLARSPHPEDKAKLEKSDRRAQVLETILARVEVVPLPNSEESRVRFGARVEVQWERGPQETFRIVGVEESDWERNEISWISPLARALMNHRAGDSVHVKRPAGSSSLIILRVAYNPTAPEVGP